MDTTPNLRPYGAPQMPNLPPVEPGSLQEMILRRAGEKYQAARLQPAAPVGADIRQTVKAAVLAFFAALLPAFLSAFLFVEGDAVIVGVVGLMALLGVLSIPVVICLHSRPLTPVRALKSYLQALGRGSYKRANALVLEADRDAMDRFQPVIDKLGQPTPAPHRFDDPASFTAYWKGLLCWRPPCYCQVRISQVQVTQLREDMALVECRVRFVMNTSLWLLSFLLVGVVAIILDIITRSTVTLPLRKVMVKTGNEWRVFNGELMGADEHDLRWLEQS
jgi:hypothetical protein